MENGGNGGICVEEREVLSALPERLLSWYPGHRRDLPWRRDRDPYHVWISEIMLQQTRVEAVREKYLRFLRELPDVRALAAAPEDRVMKLWEGLGYYSRARNLQKTARILVERNGGAFPETREEIRALPGIGDYTAGAICSICYGMPTPAVDGNVLRVLSRLLTLEEVPAEPAVRGRLTEELAAVYPAGACGTFTQALMELGATVCLPNGTPRCGKCPLRDLCGSAGGQWKRYPLRAEKKPRREEKRTVFLFTCGDRIALEKRPETGLLAGLWQFPNVPGELDEAQALAAARGFGISPAGLRYRLSRSHVFTHIRWDMTAYRIECACAGGGFLWTERDRVSREYSLPTAFRQFLEDETMGKGE